MGKGNGGLLGIVVVEDGVGGDLLATCFRPVVRFGLLTTTTGLFFFPVSVIFAQISKQSVI